MSSSQPSPTASTAPAAAGRSLLSMRQRVSDQAPRVARLGGWGERIGPDTLLARLPDLDEHGALRRHGAGGFDAGVACALDLIPRDRQGLAAALHAAYTPDHVDRARRELDLILTDELGSPQDPAATDAAAEVPEVARVADLEATWWLAACAVCEEEPSTPERFLAQVSRFAVLAQDPVARLWAARLEARSMLSSFTIRDGFAFALRDGGMQGAYLAGYDVAGQYAAAYDLYFLGTFRRTLGLELFSWREPGDAAAASAEQRMGRSGPVFGSTQFVKCCDASEFAAAAAAARPRD